jgi:hypothetical protein
MVNGWLKSLTPAANNGRYPDQGTKRAHFTTKAALTSKPRRGPGRSEVVLDQTILGLLINGAAAFAAGN